MRFDPFSFEKDSVGVKVFGNQTLLDGPFLINTLKAAHVFSTIFALTRQ